MKKFVQEFSKFISKGNVIDLAVGIMIGTSFQKIVSSLVNNIFMPLISWLVSTDLSSWFITLQPGVPVNPEEMDLMNPPSGWETLPIRLQYGLLIQSLIDFLLIALLLFFVVKAVAYSEKVRLRIEKDLLKKKKESKKEIKG
jgi:large conductance mechanosensitive channel